MVVGLMHKWFSFTRSVNGTAWRTVTGLHVKTAPVSKMLVLIRRTH